MAHLHEVHDSDIYFVIDPITREIKTESKKILLVQGDHNAERFTFRLPKLIEFHDMTECDLVTIHFINISGTQTEEQSKGVYEVNDVHVCSDNEDEIEFTWLISENATQYAGTLAFCIRFECTTNGIVDYRWQTGIHKNIAVTNSYFNANEVLEAFPDILAQWKAELFEAGGDSVVNVNVAKEEAIQAIKAEGTTQINHVKAAAEEIKAERNLIHLNHALKASVITGSAEGETILLDDSAEMPLARLNVFGKSTQDGTPTPEAPVEINSVENPTITVTDGNENEQKISFLYTLHGIPVTSSGNYTDADGQKWICDEIDFANGKYIQRCEETVLNGETSVLSLRGEINGTIYVITKDNNRYIPKTNLLSDKLLMRNTIYSAAVEGIRVEGTESSFGLRFRIATARLNSVNVAGVKEFLTNNPIRVVAPLVEPIEIPLSEAEIEAFKSLVTNYPTTTILNDSRANMAIEYGIDTKTYIDKKFEELKTAILAEE